jgi:enoyl-CoA hydratase/carnithine racemase
MEMLLTGELIDAETAMDWGLLNRVVPRMAAGGNRGAGAQGRRGQLVRGLLENTPSHAVDLDQKKAYEYTREVMSMNAVADDAQEGMTAFLEKRKPCWRADRKRGNAKTQRRKGDPTFFAARSIQSAGVSSRSRR